MYTEEVRIHFCQTEKYEPGQTYGPVMRPHYILHLILKGKGILQRGTEFYHPEAGDLLLVRPEELVYYEADEYTPWEYIMIAFDGSEADALIADSRFETEPLCHLPDDRDPYIRCAKRLVEEFHQMPRSHMAFVGSLLHLLAPFERDPLCISPHFKQEYVNRAKDFLKSSFCYDVMIQEAAQYAGIDRSYLYRLFMSLEGISPKQYLLECRLEAAKKMLETGKYRMVDTVYSCGFCDLPSFTEYFTEHYQISPEEFLWKFQR